MLPPGLLKEIRDNPILAPHLNTVKSFHMYLRSTARCNFILHGETVDNDGYNEITKEVEYIHRWHPAYQKSVLARFYQLDSWIKDKPSPVSMLTLTTYQNGQYSESVKGHIVTIPESFDILKTSWGKLRQALHRYIPDLNYLWLMEAHKSGYPHYHVPIFNKIDENKEKSIWDLWTRKYGAAAAQHGVDFSIRNSGESVKSLRNYLMKYMFKSFHNPKSKFAIDKDMTAGRHVFNALVWKNHWRLFGATKDLADVMRYNKNENLIDWFAVELRTEDGECQTIWEKEGSTFNRESEIEFITRVPPGDPIRLPAWKSEDCRNCPYYPCTIGCL
jgi:hypothetical protein